MSLPTTLTSWLARCEQSHPKEIDLTLDRTRDVLARLQFGFEVPVITVAGTNGKGSTCAMLEAIALQAGYRVGLYAKPHLVHFEERCRVNGAMVAAQELVPHFEAVEAARQGTSLTYFEFTTLAIARLLSTAPLDLVILEVGLGGRLDAVNAFDTDCAVITSVDIDHVDYLGSTREAIGFEKAGIMRSGKPVIVSDPVPPQSVLDHAERIGAELWCLGRDFNVAGDKQQWNWVGRGRRYNALAYPALRGANQLLNAAGALAAFDALRDRLPITAQAVRNGLALVELPGRFQVLAGQPTLVLDVAHNLHAVSALVQNLDQMGFHPRTHAVFGAMRDKDIAAMLTRMAPVVDTWHFTDLPTARAARASELAVTHRGLQLKGPGPVATACHADPQAALRAALADAGPTDRIVVFGSFFTVGGVLKDGIPRLTGQHAA
jgi:dihydrofolate synthase / folylpolyglutamate synthase